MNWLDCIFATSLAGTGSMVGDRIKPVVVKVERSVQCQTEHLELGQR